MSTNETIATPEFDFIPLSWDTELFGVRSAKVILKSKITLETFKSILEMCSSYEFIVINNENNNEYNNYLIGMFSNAFLVDIQVVFSKNISYTQISDNVSICNNYKYSQQIIEIAKKNFTTTRFYKDPNIQTELADQVYAKWTMSAFESSDKYFAVYKDGDQVEGFFLFGFDSSGNLDQGKGFLVVDKKCQGKGVGKNLINSLEAYGFQYGAKVIYGGTQIDNIKMVNHYFANGYKYTKRNSIYHMWIK